MRLSPKAFWMRTVFGLLLAAASAITPGGDRTGWIALAGMVFFVIYDPVTGARQKRKAAQPFERLTELAA